MLKSPPRIMQPSANHFSSEMTVLQNVMCALLGKYTFARVIGDPSHVPFRKMYRPSGSDNCCLILNGVFLFTRIVTPLVLANGFVA